MHNRKIFVMKKLLWFAIFFPPFWGCQNSSNGVYEKLEYIDTLLNNFLVDSAFHEINGIDTSSFSKLERAYYDLLKVQTKWKANIPISSDHLLDSCMSYFEHAKDKEKIARAYYYKGVLLNEEKNTIDAISYLKKSEAIANDIDDVRLKNKVYSTMYQINNQSDELESALLYAKMTLDCSKKMNSAQDMLHDMQNLGVSYYRLGFRDSAINCLEQCLPLIQLENKEDQARMIGNLGLMYKKVDEKRAETLLKQSITMKPYDFAMNSLANLYKKRGETELAESLYVKALSISTNLTQQINILTAYRNLKTSKGEFEEANELAGRLSMLKDSLAQKRTRENVGMRQTNFDHQMEQQRAAKRITITKRVLVLTAILLVGLYAFYVIRTKRMRRQLMVDQKRLMEINKEYEEAKAHMEMLKKKNRLQSDQLRTAELKMERLRKEQEETVDIMMQKYKATVARGHQLYDEVMSGGNISRWNRKDMKAFCDYYAMCNPTSQVLQDYNTYKFTPSQYMLLVLQDIQLDDERIMHIMNMSEGALRTLRSRMTSRKATVAPLCF